MSVNGVVIWMSAGGLVLSFIKRQVVTLRW